MVERIRELCKGEKVSFSALEKKLGFANGSIAKTNEKTEVWRIAALADYFDVSMEYIFCGKAGEHMTADEKELLRVFRTLNRSGRDTLASLMKTIAATPEYQNMNTKKLSGSEIA